MNISQEPNGELNAIIHLNIQESDYIGAVNKQLSDYRKKASIPGFRPGMVPMGMIKKKYGIAVLVDEVNKTVSNALNDYLVENKVSVLGNPLPNMEKTTQLDFDTQKDFDFFFDIGLAPEFSVELDKEFLKIPYYTVLIDEDEIDKAVEDVKVRFGTEEHPETAGETDGLQGHFFRINEEGKRTEGDEGKKLYLKIADIKNEETQKAAMGIKKGEMLFINPMADIQDETKVKVLLGLTAEESEGLNATYQFEIEEIIHPVDGELGEDLYKKVFPAKEIDSEEAFREALGEDIKKHFVRDTDQQFLADTAAALIEKLDIKLPDDFLKRSLLESNQGKITIEQIEEQYDSYARTFRWQLIEGKLMNSHPDQLVVHEEEVRGKIAAYFKSYGGSADLNPQIEGIIDQILSNKDEKQRLYTEILDGKFIEFFKNTITTLPEEVTKDKFFEIASQVK
ncbi:MAG: trigger factor [Bacteroidales bacterium]|nr:trigger factor [Bacteroidales bacterium]